jgi:hypothetical protein
LVEEEATVSCHKVAVIELPWSNKVEADWAILGEQRRKICTKKYENTSNNDSFRKADPCVV